VPIDPIALECALLLPLRRMVIATALLATLLALGAAPLVAADDGTYTARAFRLCERADGAPDEQAEALLREGLRLAELAVEQDDKSADAHFAVFCTLGKLVERDGIGLGSVGKVRRARRELDRTLQLDPEHLDAILAKAELLSRLPVWLGGDAAEAERYRARAAGLQLKKAGRARNSRRASAGVSNAG
jgi:hypothetical protein